MLVHENPTQVGKNLTWISDKLMGFISLLDLGVLKWSVEKKIQYYSSWPIRAMARIKTYLSIQSVSTHKRLFGVLDKSL
ncbi:unnamed protein product [Camellia sinensis]